jgi:hypothetical protein
MAEVRGAWGTLARFKGEGFLTLHSLFPLAIPIRPFFAG